MLLPLLEKKCGNKGAYVISLVVGAIGFISIFWVTNKWILFLSYLLIGAAWAAMLALPFTIFTNTIAGSKYMGTLLGLFNCTITIPQIIAAALGGKVLGLFPVVNGIPQQQYMLVLAGVLLLLGAASVFTIKEKE